MFLDYCTFSGRKKDFLEMPQYNQHTMFQILHIFNQSHFLNLACFIKLHAFLLVQPYFPIAKSIQKAIPSPDRP